MLDRNQILRPALRAFGASVILLCSSTAIGQTRDWEYERYCIAFDLDARMADGTLPKPRSLATRPPKFRLDLGSYADSAIGENGTVSLRVRPAHESSADFWTEERLRAEEHCDYVDIGHDLSEVRASDSDECEIGSYAIRYWSNDREQPYDVTHLDCVDSSSICDMTNSTSDNWNINVRFPPELRPQWKLILDDARQFLAEGKVQACEGQS